MCIISDSANTYIDIEFYVKIFDVLSFDVKSLLSQKEKNTLNLIRRLVFSVIGFYEAEFESNTF